MRASRRHLHSSGSAAGRPGRLCAPSRAVTGPREVFAARGALPGAGPPGAAPRAGLRLPGPYHRAGSSGQLPVCGHERLALAGFLAGYSGLTREAYALDLRQFTNWCQQRRIRLFQARRADIECFARDLETRGRARATITRGLCAIAGFYRYAVEEDPLDHSPAAHVRRLRLDYESHATGLDRNELGALLVAAGLGSPGGHALISLLALNGLRVSEATGDSIEALGVERGHRTLVITHKAARPQQALRNTLICPMSSLAVSDRNWRAALRCSR
jgi:hypothetical protein